MRFSVETQSFYPDSIIYDELPDDVVEITEIDHSTYLSAITSGCYIYSVGGVLTISPPRPDQYYEWDAASNTWTISAAAEQQQKDDAIAAATQQKSALKAAADSEIAWRLDAVDSGIATEEETVALSEWKKYRVLLMRVDTAKPVWPTPPVA